MSELGRVTDPRALDASTGACGRVRVVIPADWAREGAAIEVVLPSKVECGVCRGGGCDRCGRSGAHRLPAAEAERTLELSLPPLEGDAVLLRVPRPFGASAELELLNVEVTRGETASSCCRLMRASTALAPAAVEPRADSTLRWLWLVALVAVLIVAALMAPLMTTLARKKALVAELSAKLRAELDAMERAQRATVEGVTSEEAKPENDKDTRALEQSYLARGQARRVEDLRDGVARVGVMPVRPFAEDAAVALGALVTIDEDDGESVLFIAPYGGGLRLSTGEQVVTPASPLGKALIGKVAGDDCELVLAGRTRAFSLREVA